MKPDLDLSKETAEKQFAEVCELINATAREMMKTPQGRETLRNEIAALTGFPLEQVVFADERHRQ